MQITENKTNLTNYGKFSLFANNYFPGDYPASDPGNPLQPPCLYRLAGGQYCRGGRNRHACAGYLQKYSGRHGQRAWLCGRDRWPRSHLWAIDGGIGRRSEEHTSELQSLMRISYAVFCLKKKKHNTTIK